MVNTGPAPQMRAPGCAGEKNSDVQFTKTPGVRVRYNAAVALAKHGSARTPIELLKEMLDESAQLEQHRVRSQRQGLEGVCA